MAAGKRRGTTMPGMKHPSAEYECYADLAGAQVEGADFQIHIERRATSGIAVVAPHGGAIEEGTSEIARAVAGSEFNLYLFEGLRASGSYAALHLTSHRFDEPQCLALLAGCDQVIAIHGCRGAAPEALLGGLDDGLKMRIGAASPRLASRRGSLATAIRPFIDATSATVAAAVQGCRLSSRALYGSGKRTARSSTPSVRCC